MNRQRLFTLLLATTLAALTLVSAPREKQNILSIKNTITDDNIVFPESFDTDVHQMMTNWYLQNYAVLDADVENKNPGEVSEETYIRRLAAIPSVIEMPYNQVVRRHIERYVYRSRTLIEEMLGMSLYYMPIFEQALEEEGLPLELKYLPIVESALDPNAVSHAGAAGLWQFMVGTGKGLGLEINSLVDERRDPYRSSAMAAKYLKNLYQIYNDWSLAIAAYNCGPGNVNKALHRNGGTGDFWDIYEYLPRETRGYVPAFIAANYAMTYYKQHNISPSLARKPLITDTVSVTRRIHFSQIAQVLNIPIEEIRAFNPQYRADVIPGDNHPYTLVLPSQQIYSFIMSEDSIDNYRDDLYAHREVVEPGGQASTAEEYLSGQTAISSMRTTTHKVARGETLASIASKYNMTTQELMALNNMSNDRVRKGDNLKVKAPTHSNASADNDEIATTVSDNSTTSGTEDLAMSDQQAEQAQFDEVKDIEREAATKAPYRGGSYTASADNEQTAQTTQASSSQSSEQSARQQAAKTNSGSWRSRNARYNERSSGSRESADKRSSSSRRSESSSHSSKSSKKQSKPKQPTEVTVQKGESLTKIAERQGVSVRDIERANGIQDGNKIKAGDKIKIPTREEARQAAAAEKKGAKSSSSSSKSGSKSSSSSSSGSSSKSGSKSGSSSKSGSKSSTSSSKSGKSSSKSGSSSSSGSSSKSGKKSSKKK